MNDRVCGAKFAYGVNYTCDLVPGHYSDHSRTIRWANRPQCGMGFNVRKMDAQGNFYDTFVVCVQPKGHDDPDYDQRVTSHSNY